jgi:hypothetical protein
MVFRGMVFRGNVVRGNVVRGNVVRGTNIEPINPGANSTIVSYNASVVNFYNASGSLARFENKKYYLLPLKTLSPTTTLAL